MTLQEFITMAEGFIRRDPARADAVMIVYIPHHDLQGEVKSVSFGMDGKVFLSPVETRKTHP